MIQERYILKNHLNIFLFTQVYFFYNIHFFFILKFGHKIKCTQNKFNAISIFFVKEKLSIQATCTHPAAFHTTALNWNYFIIQKDQFKALSPYFMDDSQLLSRQNSCQNLPNFHWIIKDCAFARFD